MPGWRAALLAVCCLLTGALICADLTFMYAPPVNPLAAGDEHLNVLHSPDISPIESRQRGTAATIARLLVATTQ